MIATVFSICIFYFTYSAKALSIYAASSALGSHIGKLNTPAGNWVCSDKHRFNDIR